MIKKLINYLKKLACKIFKRNKQAVEDFVKQVEIPIDEDNVLHIKKPATKKRATNRRKK